jgi:hypothetical protein
LAGELQIVENGYGRIVFKEAQQAIASSHQTERKKSVRNVAFSIVLSALALLQIAVVAAELSHSQAQVAAVANGELGARPVVLASPATETIVSTL